MKFPIVAHDGKGKKAKALPPAVRPSHPQRVKRLVDRGQLEVGGALLDDDGGMIGAMMVVDFMGRRALDAFERSLRQRRRVEEGCDHADESRGVSGGASR